MENNLTRLSKTRIDRQNLGERKNLGERETISDVPTRIETTQSEPIFNIPTRIETTRSEPIFDIPTRIKTIHGPKVTSDPDPPPSDSSDSLSSCSEKKSKKRKDKKKRRKNRKDDSSYPSSSDDYDDSDSSDDSHYRHRRRRNKKHWKKDPIRLCTTLTAKLLTTAFKSKMIRFKLDEDPLQRRIYFLTFIESLNMVFSQYRETYEVIREYPKLEGGNIKDYAKMAIRNLLHANICVHSRRLIAEFPDDGIQILQI